MQALSSSRTAVLPNGLRCLIILSLLCLLGKAGTLRADLVAGPPPCQNILVVEGPGGTTGLHHAFNSTQWQSCGGQDLDSNGWIDGWCHTITYVSTVPGSLAGYDQVWDVRFDQTNCGSPTCSSTISAAEQTLYRNFLAAGNSLYILSENFGFPGRNDSVIALVDSVDTGGAGSFGNADGFGSAGYAALNAANAALAENINSDFYGISNTARAGNSTGRLWTEFPGGFANIGSGIPVWSDPVTGDEVVIAFPQSALAAPYNAGKLLVVTDWQLHRDDQCGGSGANNIFFSNAIDFLTIATANSPTPTSTPSRTPTPSPSPSPTRTITPTATPSATPSHSPSPSPTRTITPTVTPSISPSASFSPSPTRTITQTATPSATQSVTFSPSPTRTVTRTATPSATESVTYSPSPTSSVTRTPTPTATQSVTFSPSPTSSVTRTITPTATESVTLSATPTVTFTRSATPTPTESMTRTATPTVTYTRTPTPTATESPIYSPTYTLTPSATPTDTPTRSSTPSFTATPSVTFSATATSTATETRTATATRTVTSTRTITSTFTFSPTASPSPIPAPIKLVISIYNEAGERVRQLYDGATEFVPLELRTGGDLLLSGPGGNGGLAILLDGRLASGGNSVTWSGENDNGQMLSGGAYYIKAEFTDQFGKVTALTRGVQVMATQGEQSLSVYNSAGELVYERSLVGLITRPTGFRLEAEVIAVQFDPTTGLSLGGLKAWVRDGSSGSEVPVSWDGRNQRGLAVASGNYTIKLVSSVAGQRSQVMTKQVTVLDAGDGRHSADTAQLGPNPWRGKSPLVLSYSPYPGAWGRARIYNQNGEYVGAAGDFNGSGRVVIVPGDWASGVYLVEFNLLLNDGVLSRKTIKLAVVR